jgi:EAL domain-containing protein (putative c-di-GMP-specific phosphodiesterase class I)
MQVTVETRERFERLSSLGVNLAQGYLLGRPVPIDELERQPQVYAHARMPPGRSTPDDALG